ncbi:PAS domain S-box protein [Natronomonas halophila]|uniref:PAS domain S-box protein n=1 Tax=Natronomonas halophila TaxID=2747817 RepID=UPI0015B662C1|nr:PAS domain S-box protein [Natronomonas halophila]QLD86766.1 PAS domain S-box protein [Natronomonas halophila]
MEDAERLATLLDLAQDKIVVIDSEGTYRYANAAVERVLGYTPDEFVGRNTFEYIHPEDWQDVHATFERLLTADEDMTDTIEYRHRSKDGSWVWLESRMLNRKDTTLDGYVVSSRDITDRKQAEAAHRETERRLEDLAANAKDVLWMFSADWEELLFVNEAYEEVYGLSTEAVADDPRSFLDAIHPNDREGVVESMARLSAGETFDMEYRVNPDRNYQRWVWAKGQPIVEDGEVTRVVGFSRDITDRRRRERQLRVMDNLLRHNLRNDMNVIIGHAELARENGSPTIAENMETILETGTNLLATAEKEREIVDIIVDIESPERVDVTALLRDAVDAVRSAFPDADIDVALPETAVAVALPEMQRALYELLENAAKHAETTAEISVRLRNVGRDVEIVITDNCPEIPDYEFEPLLGTAELSDMFHGTGLGLWLVYWIVDLSDGSLKFEPTDEGGNRVAIRLPRAD